MLENVLVGLLGGRPGSLAAALLGPPSVRAREWRLRAEARGLLAFVGYAGDPDALARNLPFGHKRLVEIPCYVFDVFDTHREPNHVGRYARGLELFFTQLPVRGGGGMDHQALGVAHVGQV